MGAKVVENVDETIEVFVLEAVDVEDIVVEGIGVVGER